VREVTDWLDSYHYSSMHHKNFPSIARGAGLLTEKPEDCGKKTLKTLLAAPRSLDSRSPAAESDANRVRVCLLNSEMLSEIRETDFVKPGRAHVASRNRSSTT
jgi:hypothetical protein